MQFLIVAVAIVGMCIATADQTETEAIRARMRPYERVAWIIAAAGLAIIFGPLLIR